MYVAPQQLDLHPYSDFPSAESGSQLFDLGLQVTRVSYSENVVACWFHLSGVALPLCERFPIVTFVVTGMTSRLISGRNLVYLFAPVMNESQIRAFVFHCFVFTLACG